MHTADLLVLVVSILNSGHENGGLVGEDQTLAVLAEVSVPSPEHGVQHALVQEEVSHPLGNDNVDLWEWKLNLLHLALEESNLIRHAVGLDNLPGFVNYRGHVHTNHVLCASLDSEPIQTPRSVFCALFHVWPSCALCGSE